MSHEPDHTLKASAVKAVRVQGGEDSWMHDEKCGKYGFI